MIVDIHHTNTALKEISSNILILVEHYYIQSLTGYVLLNF